MGLRVLHCHIVCGDQPGGAAWGCVHGAFPQEGRSRVWTPALHCGPAGGFSDLIL